MERRASSLLVLAVAALAFGACTAGAANVPTMQGAAPTAAHILPAGQVAELTDPGVPLTTPADGRLRGYGFSAVVTGVAASLTAGPTNTPLSAAAGRHLVVFTLAFANDSNPNPTNGSTAPPLTADVATGGTHTTLDPSSLTAHGHATYAVSVPNHIPDVDLEMTVVGFTQAFSLTTLHRVASQPTVLYRDPVQSSVNLDLNQTQPVPVTVAADGFAGEEILGVQSAELTYFQPGAPGIQPADPGQAYLAVTGTDASDPSPPPGYPANSHFVNGFTALPPPAVTLTVPGGPPLPATHVGSTTNGLLDGTYYFSVPADLSAATLSVTPGTVTGVEYPVFTGDTAQVTFPQPGTFNFTFPPAPAPAPGEPSTSTLPITTLNAAPSLPGQARGGGALWWLLGVVVVAVLVMLGLWLVRRRPFPARSIRDRPPPYRPLRPPSGLSAPTPLALPPGPPVDSPGAASEPRPSPNAHATMAGGTQGPGHTDLAVDPEPIPASIPTSRLIEILVLGPLQVSGWVHRPRRKVGLALLSYLALHPGHPVSGAQLLDALWPIDSARKEANRASLHSYMSDLRGALGEGVLPDAGTTDGYLLSGAVVTDWGTFTALTSEAEDAEPAEAAELRSKALSLIRGIPFEGSVGDRFEWTATEHHIAAIEVAITECAHRLSAWCLETGDTPGGSEAARIGLLGVPDAWLSHADLIRAAQAGGDPAALRRAWKGARRRLGDEAVSRLSDELGTDPPHGVT
jgi:hypothetical protein